MTIHTFNARVGRIPVRGVLRNHHVTDRAAKLLRVHVPHACVRARGHDRDIGHGQEGNESEETDRSGPGYFNLWNVPYSALAPGTTPDAKRDHHESQHEEGRKHDEDNEAVIRIRKTLKCEGEKYRGRSGRDDRTNAGNPVTQ